MKGYVTCSREVIAAAQSGVGLCRRIGFRRLPVDGVQARRPAVVIVRTSGRVVPPRSGGRPISVAGLGSGVLVDIEGKVVTAAHVVQTADVVSVEFPGN